MKAVRLWTCVTLLGLTALPVAHAYTVSGSPGPLTTTVGAVTFATFDAPTNPLIASISGGCASCGTDPGGIGSWLTAGTPIPTSIHITFTGPMVYFGLVWGSPESDNTMLVSGGGSLLGIFGGSAATDTYMNFTATSTSEYFDSISFFTSGSSFEIDNLAARFAPTAAIPEPSTYALMLAGLGIVGFVAKRRRIGEATS